MNPDSMSGCVYKNGLPEVVAMIFSVSISFVDTVLAPGDFKKIMKKKGATFAQEIRPNINIFVRVPGREDSGTRLGGSVTGVTEKLFMCQMFMCLFRPLRLQTDICSEGN